MRLVKNDPLIAAWYRARGGYRGDRKLTALIAETRKLARALWHLRLHNDRAQRDPV